MRLTLSKVAFFRRKVRQRIADCSHIVYHEWSCYWMDSLNWRNLLREFASRTARGVHSCLHSYIWQVTFYEQVLMPTDWSQKEDQIPSETFSEQSHWKVFQTRSSHTSSTYKDDKFQCGSNDSFCRKCWLERILSFFEMPEDVSLNPSLDGVPPFLIPPTGENHIFK